MSTSTIEPITPQTVAEPLPAARLWGMVAMPIDGAMIRRGRARLVGDTDLAGRSLARRLSQQADSWFESLGHSLPAGWALIATGGYAGGVLCPGSDIDVILLHPPKTGDAQVREVAEGLWYPLWDGGIKLSQGVHTPKSMLQLASDDLETATTILRIRCLAGDERIAHQLQADAIEKTWNTRKFPDGGDFYDYEAKYADGGSRHTIPARIHPLAAERAMEVAVAAHNALGCRGVSRSDFRYDDSFGEPGQVVLLEVNTQPGMTPTRLCVSANRARSEATSIARR